MSLDNPLQNLSGLMDAVDVVDETNRTGEGDQLQQTLGASTSSTAIRTLPADGDFVDRLASFWRHCVRKDKRSYAHKMERIRREQEAPPTPPLYFDDLQRDKHRLIFSYMEGLMTHEGRVERHKAIHETRNLLQTVMLMEQQR